jgi:hypothetical protein
MEMHTIRARLTTGLLNKAERGELALALPMGLTRDPFGRVHKTPDQAVQHSLDLIFQTFLRVRTASKVLQYSEVTQLSSAAPELGVHGSVP